MPVQAIHNEKELLEEIAAGNRAAFRELHDHYWNELYSVAMSFLKSPDWAQDIIQEVFLKVWIKKEQLPQVEQFSSWLFIIARNELISALRSKARSTALQEKYRQWLPDDFLLPDSKLSLKELEQLIGQATAQLPEQQRLIYEMTRHEGLRHDEIALRLGIATKTVSNTITKALNNIRQYLEERGEGLAWILLILSLLEIL